MRHLLITTLSLLMLVTLTASCAPKPRENGPETLNPPSINNEQENSPASSDPDVSPESLNNQSGPQGSGPVNMPENEESEGLNWIGRAEAPSQSGLLDTAAGETNVPEGWPDYIPIPAGLTLQSSVTNGLGGIRATFGGAASLDLARSTYGDLFDDWKDAETVPAPVLGSEAYKLSKYKNNETFSLEAAQSTSQPPTISVVLSWNWFTPPGVKPAGWPDEIPVMNGLEILHGFMDENGALNLVLKGSGTVDPIGEWYVSRLNGWKTEQDPITTGTLVLNYSRDKELLRITGNTLSGAVYVWINWHEIQ